MPCLRKCVSKAVWGLSARLNTLSILVLNCSIISDTGSRPKVMRFALNARHLGHTKWSCIPTFLYPMMTAKTKDIQEMERGLERRRRTKRRSDDLQKEVVEAVAAKQHHIVNLEEAFAGNEGTHKRKLQS